MFTNLTKEMKVRKVTQKDLSILLNIDIKSVNRKIKGHTEFTLSEIHKIKNNCFNDLTLEYLFKREGAN